MLHVPGWKHLWGGSLHLIDTGATPNIIDSNFTRLAGIAERRINTDTLIDSERRLLRHPSLL